MKKLVIICAIVLLSGCSSGGTNSSGGTLVVAGTWVGFFASTVISKAPANAAATRNRVVAELNMNILQEGNNFSGIYQIFKKQCNLEGGTVTGTISGTQVTMTLTDNGTNTVPDPEPVPELLRSSNGPSITRHAEEPIVIVFNGNLTNAIEGTALAMSGLLNTTAAICGAFTGNWSMNRS